ncbi:serine/threonine protein kinase [Capronia epimyces CBS 606.96]|uniref:Serine/threonine protein kinase n=1 Tax=Capronia epimyces CBS 606.96 TaxID=1182542 RepID=W9XZX2_9EURO|nr:serine/threonine protein kinase [Capronia epimyces CBS 606.96]EXJ82900.1 serine/threonine protein kinase [Capronia epimyces CBS 606.96]
MSVTSMSRWTEERVAETVTSAYIQSHLRPNEQELLQKTLYFGGDLTDDTYLDRILNRARRFFLILVATGVPEQIFGIIDDSYDDEDLPIAEHAVIELRLSFEPDRSLDKRFYKTQFRFLTRVIGEGEHIRYADEETVPIIPLSLKSMVLARNHEGPDRVRLATDPPKMLLRRRIALDAEVSEEDILSEIAGSRKLCHEHIVSVFGSYLYQGVFNVLSLPGAEWTLKTFLTETPKMFSNLSKAERRTALITWPHCLASALVWLHGNGEYHGAIRPSNIQVDESFNISLGLLDGEGHLRDTARPDDIEAYQYGPPERWKRAVTVQNTGPMAIALPSGGRTGRRIGHNRKGLSPDGKDSTRSRSTSITTTYTFQPTSKGAYARLRLNVAMSPDVTPASIGQAQTLQSHPGKDSVPTQATPRSPLHSMVRGKTPSVISSDSYRVQHSSQGFGGPIFVSAPESRSAVVQTWQSVEEDMFASDIFSLGATIMDIMNLLCKRSYSSFSRHRSARNRMAGRGGGLADASFHANLGQVFLWAESLHKEAEKKAHKDESQVYHAVGPVVQLALQCLERDPAARLTGVQLEKRLEDCICRCTGMGQLHCRSARGESRQPTASIPVREHTSSGGAIRNTKSVDRLRQDLQNSSSPDAEWKRQQQHLVLPDASTLQAHLGHTPPSVATTPGATSDNSLLAFNFDGFSDTIVAESPRLAEHSPPRPSRRGEVAIPRHEVVWSADQASSKRAFWKTLQNNDSQVDPRLSFGDSIDTGAFTYINYSSSASSEEDHMFLPRSYTDPPSPAPNRALPAVPPLQTKVRSTRPERQVAPIKRLEETVAPLGRFSDKATGRKPPPRVDSLPKMRYHEEDDYWDSLRHARPPEAMKASSRSRSRHGRERGYAI